MPEPIIRKTITYGLSLPVREDRGNFCVFMEHLARNLDRDAEKIVSGLVVAEQYDVDDGEFPWTATVVLEP
ncbi:hypothetical protein E4J89_15070 [Arthrobacter sp. CAU 1506]|uniref:hypothetical protein n=1 Tax=Arthrobacter sp. CAU 1506 TaxID=2560052 RepID=UPI0010AC98AE|nr:hypothetical protein [Arthrobacter sp. CAU 1506]TJY67406.1 hypothetical protein E4J89_15070 [Arthrobacter sp. CAU 1506]